MIDEIVACLDGSPQAESILPYARGIAMAIDAPLTLLCVIESKTTESTAKRYLNELSDHFHAREKTRSTLTNAAGGILEELGQNPNSLPALTTHGRAGLMETLFGSVALAVIRGAGRPVLTYRPQPGVVLGDQPRQIKTVIAPLDGSDFSEKILVFAAALADQLHAGLQLVQVLEPPTSGSRDFVGMRGDVLESSYLQRKARATAGHWGTEADWDVLHGEPGPAICAYLKGRPDELLAMTSHARAGLERTFFGSVSGECLRQAGVPVLIYWPH